jgi:hypothetical protein
MKNKSSNIKSINTNRVLNSVFSNMISTIREKSITDVSGIDIVVLLQTAQTCDKDSLIDDFIINELDLGKVVECKNNRQQIINFMTTKKNKTTIMEYIENICKMY